MAANDHGEPPKALTGKKKKKADMEDLKKEMTIDDHQISLEECQRRFETNLEIVSNLF